MSGRASAGSAGLSRRDEVLLGFVAQVSVASAIQLERMAFPPSDPDSPASQRSATRRARRRLEQLSQAGYLSRLDRRIGGVASGSSGYLYRLGTKGKRVLDLPGRGARIEPSERFASHQLAIGELHVELTEAERAGRLSRLSVLHEPATWRRYTSAHGSLSWLKPDLLVELAVEHGGQLWQLRWFIETDLGTEHLPTVLAKCQRYVDYWRSGVEAAYSDVFPRVLWSVPDDRRAGQLHQALGAKRGWPEGLFVTSQAGDQVAALTSVTAGSQEQQVNERR